MRRNPAYRLEEPSAYKHHKTFDEGHTLNVTDNTRRVQKATNNETDNTSYLIARSDATRQSAVDNNANKA